MPAFKMYYSAFFVNNTYYHTQGWAIYIRYIYIERVTIYRLGFWMSLYYDML